MSTKHAEWSASSSERNIPCPGNITLSKALPKVPAGYAARWGTACHELSEKCLNTGKDADHFAGNIIVVDEDGQRDEFEVDDDMIDCANTYVTYIRDRCDEGFEIVGIEVFFNFDELGTKMEAGGTGDCVLYHRERKHLESVDLKTGKGVVVEVLGNTQTRMYAIGSMLSFKHLPVETFTSTIVQPRAPHRHGRIRSEVLEVIELFDWSLELFASINEAADAKEAFLLAAGNSVLMDEWVEKYLHPGEHCEFCKAKGGCPKLRNDAFKTAGAEYDGDLKFKSNRLADNAPDVVERDLEMLNAMEEWIAGRRALAHQMAKDGHKFKNWQLVEKIGRRKFDFATPEQAAAAIRKRLPVTDEQLYQKKLNSPAQLEKSIGKKVVADVLGDLIVNPVTGTDLVRKDAKATTYRRPVGSTAERFYQE